MTDNQLRRKSRMDLSMKTMRVGEWDTYMQVLRFGWDTRSRFVERWFVKVLQGTVQSGILRMRSDDTRETCFLERCQRDNLHKEP